MANWNDRPVAFVTIWITLHDLKQLASNYADSENLKMSDLTFYNPLSSDTERAIAAKMLADQIDNTLIKTYRCKYETGVNSSGAVNTMVSILTDGEKLVIDLCQKCDTLYKFITE